MDDSIITTDWCKITQVGLRITREPTWEEYEEQIYMWTRAHRLSAWAIADLYNYGERQWGETYAQAMDETGLSYGYIANICSVASKIDLDRRNENLSFSHHAAVAPLPPERQDYWLATADGKCLSRNDLRDAVKGLPPSDEPEIIITPKLSLRQVVATYVQATWKQDITAQEDAWDRMVKMVKDLL